MAKRRKLTAPSSADLSALEDEFRRETSAKNPMSAPIAQVAAEAAEAGDKRSPEDRAQAAANARDAKVLKEAEDSGRLIKQIALTDIDDMALIRDRMVLDAEDLEELKRSISANGLRLPIEVFEKSEPGDGPRYGLLSGYRRYRAMSALAELWAGEKFTEIAALVRDPDAMGGTFAAMVEENEVRANLSHFERGRIAVLAAQEGAFVNVEAAVDALFSSASKAKRSKIRSFSLIFEELGDLFVFPEAMREKDGLKLATALRAGHEARLRTGLGQEAPASAADEQARLATLLAEIDTGPVDPSRGGRPKTRTPRESRVTDTGVRIGLEQEGGDWLLRLSGGQVNAELARTIVAEIERLLSKP